MALKPFLIISIILSIFRFSLLEESLFSRKTTESFRVCLAAKLVRRTSPAAWPACCSCPQPPRLLATLETVPSGDLGIDMSWRGNTIFASTF